MIEKIEKFQKEIIESCSMGEQGLTSFGSSLHIRAGKLIEAIENETITESAAWEFADSEEGGFELELFQLAIDAGAKET